MQNDRISITAAKSVQTQIREDQRKYGQPRTPAEDEDKGGKILAQPAKGTKKQMIGTVVGIIVVIAVLALLGAFHII
jgi:hypothetical protein